MKNIGFITVGLGFGGAEKMLCFVANELSKRGNNVFIFNLNTVPDYVSDKFQYLEERIHIFEVSNGGILSKINLITRLAKENKIDILIGFTSKPNLLARVVAMRLRIPSIISERGDPTKTSVGSFKSRLMKFVINTSRGGVFQTEGAMKYYGRGLRRRGVVIPNPIFVKENIPRVNYENRCNSVVSFGRLDNYQKRYDVMIDAFERFFLVHPNYVLKIYGKGNDEEKIKSWAEKSKAKDSILFMGLSTNPMNDIAKDGMFLITSDFEGISNSLLEAMAVGLPCVSTDHTPGGARLLITDHENGLLAPIGDAEKLAEAMCEFAENPEFAKKCGVNATQVVERFAPEKIVDMWDGYINKIVKK